MARMRPLVDRALGGRLESELRKRRSRSESFDTIARWLLTEHDIHVTAQSVRLWARELGIPDPPKPKANPEKVA